MKNQWNNFSDGAWTENIDVRNFIQKNYKPYGGDESFLTSPTLKTKNIWEKSEKLILQEIKKGGVLDVDTKTVSGVDNFKPGYIDKENEVVFGLQTDAPLKRMVNPFGGIRMAQEALEDYGYKVDDEMHDIFTKYRKTHNEAVFDAYTEEMKAARHVGLLTGLPDAYGRGRIIGDFRRIADAILDELKDAE